MERRLLGFGVVIEYSVGMSDEYKIVEGRSQLPAFADSRFLFVDVAAQRAKQLRRGALVRLEPVTEGTGHRTDMPHKLERIAMEEVRQGLIIVHAPPLRGSRGEIL